MLKALLVDDEANNLASLEFLLNHDYRPSLFKNAIKESGRGTKLHKQPLC